MLMRAFPGVRSACASLHPALYAAARVRGLGRGIMITIDGSTGEGGGQILRTALALSLVTGQPFRLEKIRAGRSKPGLLRQHLTAIEAATKVGRASIDGATLGSKEICFRPGSVQPAEYRFAIGSEGSTTPSPRPIFTP